MELQRLMNISHQRCNYTMKKRCREWIVYEKTNMEKGTKR